MLRQLTATTQQPRRCILLQTQPFSQRSHTNNRSVHLVHCEVSTYTRPLAILLFQSTNSTFSEFVEHFANMSLPFDLDSLPPPRTRLPAIKRSPSPNLLDSMKDLVPAPLRSKSRSPILRPRTSNESNRTQPIQVLGARAGWDSNLPKRTEDEQQACSVSPRPTHRAPAPAPGLARTGNTSPRQRYLHVPPEYLHVQRVNEVTGSTGHRPELPKANTTPSPRSTREPKRSPLAMRSQVRLGGLAPGVPSGRSRRHVPSMVDYLSLEQLENLWESQDLYQGPVDVPQKPGSPIWRIGEDDPRSPIHPAFRPHYSIHNSFARPVV